MRCVLITAGRPWLQASRAARSRPRARADLAPGAPGRLERDARRHEEALALVLREADADPAPTQRRGTCRRLFGLALARGEPDRLGELLEPAVGDLPGHPATSILFALNLASGLATEVGHHGVNVGRQLNYSGLAFGADGTLYSLGSTSASAQGLYSVNPANGAATLIGDTIIQFRSGWRSGLRAGAGANHRQHQLVRDESGAQREQWAVQPDLSGVGEHERRATGEPVVAGGDQRLEREREFHHHRHQRGESQLPATVLHSPVAMSTATLVGDVARFRLRPRNLDRLPQLACVLITDTSVSIAFAQSASECRLASGVARAQNRGDGKQTARVVEG